MGVAGSGKTTMARRLADATGGLFLDADDFQPAVNKAKMASGHPLDDADRAPWLDRLNAELRARPESDRPVFLACSALKQSYRERLATGLPGLRFIYLKGSFELIRARMEQRRDHFMPVSLLESQFATLEEPSGALVLDISRSENQLVADYLSQQSANG